MADKPTVINIAATILIQVDGNTLASDPLTLPVPLNGQPVQERGVWPLELDRDALIKMIEGAIQAAADSIPTTPSEDNHPL
ncbi:hypothetical protein GCM10022198_00350 [Klugiella xanthotipulae]|uniref:Uncharacterized protein n=1 Tax=Klugiella xanthotipulae TaxID=244735 RepID=A0A543I5E0_9MICO|nr:hypothetical protein [Klugiella xanthotipulae]TQM65826.1 hypothetical protein FB466_0639 [Klugiella xanthotipulae]